MAVEATDVIERRVRAAVQVTATRPPGMIFNLAPPATVAAPWSRPSGAAERFPEDTAGPPAPKRGRQPVASFPRVQAAGRPGCPLLSVK
jgi:hypothetical protein